MIKNFLSETDFLFDTVLFILTVTVPHDPLNAIQSYSVAIQTRSIIIRSIQYFIQNNAKILQKFHFWKIHPKIQNRKLLS